MENTWDGTAHDYTRKRHIIYTEVLLPENAPPEYADRAVLWNSVEWNEKTRDAQLARSVELALPAELNHEQNIALIRKFVQTTFVDKGMCADIASYAEAVKKVSTEFYDLHSKHKKNENLSLALSARTNVFEDEKKYRKAYNTRRRLSGSKTDAFEREHEFELRKSLAQRRQSFLRYFLFLPNLFSNKY